MNSARLRYLAVSVAVLAAFALAYYYTTTDSSAPSDNLIAWHSYDEGVALAKQENKKLLVDVYTTWCTWCKKMDSEVYTNAHVIKAVNEHFIPVKLNAESEKTISFQGKALKESEFAHELGVSGYPTTVFLDPESLPITSVPGYSPADRFVHLIRFIGQDYYKTISFQDYLARSTSTR